MPRVKERLQKRLEQRESENIITEAHNNASAKLLPILGRNYFSLTYKDHEYIALILQMNDTFNFIWLTETSEEIAQIGNQFYPGMVEQIKKYEQERKEKEKEKKEPEKVE